MPVSPANQSTLPADHYVVPPPLGFTSLPVTTTFAAFPAFHVASDKFAAESQSACPTLWQPFLAEITQIPAKCDLPLPPKEWTNMNQKEIKQSPSYKDEKLPAPFSLLKQVLIPLFFF